MFKKVKDMGYIKSMEKHKAYEVYSSLGKQTKTKKEDNQKLQIGSPKETERNSDKYSHK